MNKHSTRLLVALLVLIFGACKEVTFPEPQPKGVASINEIPEPLRGRYVPDAPAEDKRDTLIIESWGYRFRDAREKDWLGKGAISDSLVIKYYKDYYFVNFHADDQWVLRLIHRQPSGSLDFLSLNVQDEATEADLIQKISNSVVVKKTEVNGDTFYEIDPTPDQLMSFIDKGYFTGIVLQRQ